MASANCAASRDACALLQQVREQRGRALAARRVGERAAAHHDVHRDQRRVALRHQRDLRPRWRASTRSKAGSFTPARRRRWPPRRQSRAQAASERSARSTADAGGVHCAPPSRLRPRSLGARTPARRPCGFPGAAPCAAACFTSSAVMLSYSRRRIEQLAVVAVEHLVLAERLRLAVDGLAGRARSRPAPGCGPWRARRRSARPWRAARSPRRSVRSALATSPAWRHDRVHPREARDRIPPSSCVPTCTAACSFSTRRWCSRDESPSPRIDSSTSITRDWRSVAAAACHAIASSGVCASRCDANAALAELRRLAGSSPAAARAAPGAARGSARRARRLPRARRRPPRASPRCSARSTACRTPAGPRSSSPRCPTASRSVGIWYGCATKAVACICSSSVPKLSLSTDERRSEYTTPRSLSTTFGSKSRLAHAVGLEVEDQLRWRCAGTSSGTRSRRSWCRRCWRRRWLP